MPLFQPELNESKDRVLVWVYEWNKVGAIQTPRLETSSELSEVRDGIQGRDGKNQE